MNKLWWPVAGVLAIVASCTLSREGAPLEPTSVGGSSSATTGAGGAMPCATANDCPASTGCATYDCKPAGCEAHFVAAGTVEPDAAGNCQKTACDGMGNLVTLADDNDLPAQPPPCKAPKCSGGMLTYSDLPDGTQCGPTASIQCQGGKCKGCGKDSDCPGIACQNGHCDTQTTECGLVNAPDGTGCDDGNKCTTNDACSSGICLSGFPVQCGGADDCHDAGNCDPGTGSCGQPTNKSDGTLCSDGDACTQVDTCQSGTCTGMSPVSCQPGDQCHDAGVCNPATGLCSMGNPHGGPCDDGDVCTNNDTCAGGTCAGVPIPCNPPDDCHTANCDPVNGCIITAKGNGAGCEDGDLCTVNDKCMGGNCMAGSPKSCTTPGVCEISPGSCNVADGQCQYSQAGDGTACAGGNCCGGQCCAGACCNGVCCGAGQNCCNNQCCSNSCCNNVCCQSTNACHNGTGNCNP